MYAREPLLVAFPRDAADVAAAIAIAGRFDVPVVTRGGGTSLAGQSVGGRGIVLDTSRHMDAIGEIDTEALRVRVGPGVVQEDLNRAAQPFGLGFGPDTSTSNRATIGGMIGNNSSGSHSIVYGTTIDHVHELEVVLADGSQRDAGPGRRRRARRDPRRPAGDPARPRATRSRPATRSTGASRAATGSTGSRASSTSRKLRRRLRGHAGGDHRGDRRPRGAAEGEAVRGRPLRLDGRRDRRDRRRARAGRGGGRDDRPHDPRAVALEARVPAHVRDARGRSRRAAVRDVLRRHAARRRATRSTASTQPGAHTATATTRCAPRRRPSRTRSRRSARPGSGC